MWRPHLVAAALFVALAVVMTWPLARLLDSAVAWPGDPFITTWVMDWDWWATFHRSQSLFDANILYPARHTLAFSENLYGIAVFLFPLRAFGMSALTANNLAILLGYAFTGFGAYLLGWTVTRSWWAGIAAGIFYAFVPFRFTHAPHVQYVWAGWLPMMIAALLHYAKRPTWPRAMLFGAAFLFNGLSNVHWLLLGTVAIAMTVLIVRPRIVPLAACTVAAGILLLPFLWPYAAAAREYGMRRSWQEAKSFSAQPRDWLVVSTSTRWYRALEDPSVDPERWLFPGAVGIALSIAGVVLARDRRAMFIALAWLLLGFLGSLGTHFFLHRFLFAHVPGFQAIRVPARWANIAYVGMSLLIALACRRRWIAVVASAALAVELFVAPILWYLCVPGAPPVYAWLRDHKPRAVLELPIGADFDYVYMLHATEHHRPIINGFSGFFPLETKRIEAMTHANRDALIPELRRIGVDSVVVHADAIDDDTRQWLAREVDRGGLSFIDRFDHGLRGDWLFATSGPPRKTAELSAYLAGLQTYNRDTFGSLDIPGAEQRIGPRGAYFSGYAFSPYGVRSVTLLLQNRSVRVTPFLFDDAGLRGRFPWYGATKPRFVLELTHRPPGVGERTDVQVEIVDGRGKRVLLDDRFIVWPDHR